MKEKFSGVTSRLSWELFKRTGKINYYLLYKNIESSPDATKEDFIGLNNDQGREL